jgi:hypothetical protein
MIGNPPVVPNDAVGRQRNYLEFKRDSALWARDQLGEDDLRWLAGMPFTHRLSPTAKAQDNLLVVHANPKDTQRFVMPPEAEQEKRLGSAQFRQTEKELDALLRSVQAGVIAFGHFHFPNVQARRNLLLANVSSISNPMDGDSHAKYGLLTWDAAAGWQVELVRVEYDIKRELDEAGLETYLAVCSVCLARAHARTGDAAGITGYIGKTNALDKAISEFAMAYADQTERDHQALTEAVASRRIVAQRGV